MKSNIYVGMSIIFALSISLLFCEVYPSKGLFQTAVYKDINDTVNCHEGSMSIYISKGQFIHVPFTIYVQDEQDRLYKATEIALQCHYFIDETYSFLLLAAPYYGCFVRRQENIASLIVVIKAVVDEGRVEIIKKVPLICKMTAITIKEEIIDVGNSPHPEHCDKDGFVITISQNATVPPLNLDTVKILSDQSPNCKPKSWTVDSVTFHFPYTSCGTQFLITDGNIIYFVNIEAEHLLTHKEGSIFRDAPFRLTVLCRYALARISHIGMEIQREMSEHPPAPALKIEGILRTELRFAKDSSYRSFYSTRAPVILELGQLVYVEVFLLKREDKELMLLLEDCWATPSQDPYDQHRWSLLAKGCPFNGDLHRTVLLSVVPGEGVKHPSHHKWFVVKLFAFMRPYSLPSMVYFHCDVEVCKGQDCSMPCDSRRRRFGRKSGGVQQHTTATCGPLIILV